jgi:DNA-binding transcriptional MocR family regulator
MADLRTLDQARLLALKTDLIAQYEAFKAQKLKLDMTRGKPCPEQLALSNGLLTCLTEKDFKALDGTDCRNYGGVDGLPEAKELFAQFLEATPAETIMGGNSSLALMYDTIARAMLVGVVDSPAPWGKLPKIKFLCPSPGYDRHFAICEMLGIEMITVPLTSDGPDMAMVEQLVAGDDAVKGIWCVPKYANPTGATYADHVVDRLAAMKTKAPDFRIFWDNAYTIHHLSDKHDQLKNILTACKTSGNPNRVYIFGSTAKVSFAGAGVGMMAGSEANVTAIKKQIIIQTIGPDKINQLRHVRFFKDMAGILAHMQKHAAILKPKFDAVLAGLEAGVGGKNIAAWHQPNGGYFVSLDVMDGCAQAVVAMAAAAGVTLTKAGATFPYGKDPRDRNIRIAPSFPSAEELKKAIQLLTVCIQLVSVERLLKTSA